MMYYTRVYYTMLLSLAGSWAAAGDLDVTRLEVRWFTVRNVSIALADGFMCMHGLVLLVLLLA